MVYTAMLQYPSPARLHFCSDNPIFWLPHQRKHHPPFLSLTCSQQASAQLLDHDNLVSLQEGDAEIKETPRRKRRKSSIGDSHSNQAVSKAVLQENIAQILSNAQKLKPGTSYYPARYSLGIDFGDARTGVAVSKGFAPRPLAVVALRGPKLETRLLELADEQMAEEFIIGLPKSNRGAETPQSNKVRCFAGRLAARAAQRGWRVYLHDEYGTSDEALNYMIMMGSTKKGRKTQVDAFAAVILLQSYFESAGRHAELVVPRNKSLQERLCQGSIFTDLDDDYSEIQDHDIQI